MKDHDYRRDLDALRGLSREGLPSRAESSRVLQEMLEGREYRSRGGLLMNTFGRTRGRRWVSTTLAAIAAIVALFLIPISYDVVVGHEVSLELRGKSLDQAQVQALAAEMGTALQSGSVAVRQLMSGASSNSSYFALTAKVNDRVRGRVERIAAGFAADLLERGIQTNTRVRQFVEEVTGSLCTAAASSVAEIWIDMEGRSSAEVAEDVRTQLAAAGIENADVAVELENGCCQISIHVPDGHDGAVPAINCRSAEGETCQGVAIDIERTSEMSDADVIAEIERQLAEQGLSGAVTIDSEGHVRIEMGEGCQ